jgi:hypothetical protein
VTDCVTLQRVSLHSVSTDPRQAIRAAAIAPPHATPPRARESEP